VKVVVLSICVMVVFSICVISILRNGRELLAFSENALTAIAQETRDLWSKGKKPTSKTVTCL